MAFLYIAKTHKDNVLKDIDRQNYFGLGVGTSGVERIDLYTFAAALGYNRGLATDLGSGKESFVREEVVVRNNVRHFFSAIFFAQHKDHITENIDHVTNTDITCALSDCYANAGFSIISDYMSQYNDHALCFKLLSDMDTMNEEYQADRKF